MAAAPGPAEPPYSAPDIHRAEEIVREASTGAGPPRSARPRRRWKTLVGILIVAGIVSTAALFTIPLTHRFSDVFNVSVEFGGVTMVAPQGSHLALNWSVSGGPASVSVYNGDGQVLYASNAPSGAFSFASTTPSDGFEANSTVSAIIYVAWSYASPIL
jgi:hypothetical protein